MRKARELRDAASGNFFGAREMMELTVFVHKMVMQAAVDDNHID